MATEISQRALRNDSGRIMRSLSSRETFSIRAAPAIDTDTFRRDPDGLAELVGI